MLAGENGEIKEGNPSEKSTDPGENVTEVDPNEITLQEVTEQLERQVNNAPHQTDVNRSQAFHNLGLTRQWLLYKIARKKLKS